jgi:hypothetical protein
VRVQGRNVRRPAERKRSRGHSVVNANGDLDVYVVHLDKALQFGARGELKPILNAMSEKMSIIIRRNYVLLFCVLYEETILWFVRALYKLLLRLLCKICRIPGRLCVQLRGAAKRRPAPKRREQPLSPG